SINRASSPCTTANADVWPHRLSTWITYVFPSCAFTASLPLLAILCCAGTRGSFAERKGIAFFTKMLRLLPGTLSLTVYRFEPAGCDQRMLLPPVSDAVTS